MAWPKLRLYHCAQAGRQNFWGLHAPRTARLVREGPRDALAKAGGHENRRPSQGYDRAPTKHRARGGQSPSPSAPRPAVQGGARGEPPAGPKASPRAPGNYQKMVPFSGPAARRGLKKPTPRGPEIEQKIWRIFCARKCAQIPRPLLTFR